MLKPKEQQEKNNFFINEILCYNDFIQSPIILNIDPDLCAYLPRVCKLS